MKCFYAENKLIISGYKCYFYYNALVIVVITLCLAAFVKDLIQYTVHFINIKSKKTNEVKITKQTNTAIIYQILN